jgi:hypothetical protein
MRVCALRTKALRGNRPARRAYNLRTLLRKDGEFQVAMTATRVLKSAPGYRGAKKLRRVFMRRPPFATVLVGPSALL